MNIDISYIFPATMRKDIAFLNTGYELNDARKKISELELELQESKKLVATMMDFDEKEPKLKFELDETKDTLSKTTSELDETKKILDYMKDKLSKTTSELDETKKKLQMAGSYISIYSF